jgi:hypothetical protein
VKRMFFSWPHRPRNSTPRKRRDIPMLDTVADVKQMGLPRWGTSPSTRIFLGAPSGTPTRKSCNRR